MSVLLEKLEAIKLRFEDVSQQIIDPEVISDQKRYIQLNKEYKDLQPLMEAHKKYSNLLSNIQGAQPGRIATCFAYKCWELLWQNRRKLILDLAITAS